MENEFLEIEQDIEENTSPIANFDNDSTLLEDLNEKYLQNQVEQGKSVSDIATDFVKAKTAMEIIKNEKGEYNDVHKEFVKEEKETLKQGFKQDKLKKQRETLTEEQKKAEAFYISVRPILEFDFSNLIHKKDNPGEEKKPKNYEERSYGIPLMVLMIILFILPYCVVSMVLALISGVNAICEAVSSFGKIARSIVFSIFIIFITIIVIYCIILGVDALFGTSIIKNI